MICLHVNEKHTWPLISVVLLKVTCSRIHCKNGNISDTVQDVITAQTTNLDYVMCLSNRVISDDLDKNSRSFTYCKRFQLQFFVRLWSSWQDLNRQRVVLSLCDSWTSCFNLLVGRSILYPKNVSISLHYKAVMRKLVFNNFWHKCYSGSMQSQGTVFSHLA